MQLKYADDLRKYQNCPPADAVPHLQEAFRYVHAALDDKRNFLPVSRLTPRRKLRLNEQCVSFALSMYETREQAVKKYAYLRNQHENFQKTAGSHLARGVLMEEDGRGCHYRSDGHFSFFEASTADLALRFTIMEKLVK